MSAWPSVERGVWRSSFPYVVPLHSQQSRKFSVSGEQLYVLATESARACASMSVRLCHISVVVAFFVWVQRVVDMHAGHFAFMKAFALSAMDNPSFVAAVSVGDTAGTGDSTTTGGAVREGDASTTLGGWLLDASAAAAPAFESATPSRKMSSQWVIMISVIYICCSVLFHCLPVCVRACK